MWSTASGGHYARGWAETVRRGLTGSMHDGAQALGVISHRGSKKDIGLTYVQVRHFYQVKRAFAWVFTGVKPVKWC